MVLIMVYIPKRAERKAAATGEMQAPEVGVEEGAGRASKEVMTDNDTHMRLVAMLWIFAITLYVFLMLLDYSQHRLYKAFAEPRLQEKVLCLNSER